MSNRLTETIHAATTLQPIYNGLGDRVGQTIDASTTDFALDVQGLPEVIPLRQQRLPAMATPTCTYPV